MARFRHWMAYGFALTFCGLALALAGIALHSIAESFWGERALAEGLLKGLNMAVISLATFELGLGVHKEYAGTEEGEDILTVLRRTISRFVGIVCIALVLEGLIMVIKYSQLDLAGNLPYPVAIITSSALLLLALGLFLRLSRSDQPAQPRIVRRRAGRGLGHPRRATMLRPRVVFWGSGGPHAGAGPGAF